jgi:putative heme-binding domain-containing protein
LLRPDHPVLTIEVLRRFLNSPDESVRYEAVRTLGTSPSPGRFEILGGIATDSGASEPLRTWSILGLAEDGSHQKARLLSLVDSGPEPLRVEAIRSLRGLSLSIAERKKLEKALNGDKEALRLLDTRPAQAAGTPDTSNSPTGPNARSNLSLDAWLTQLQGPSDAVAGERVFFHSKGPGCYRCHQVEGRGARTGPDLTRLSKGMDRRRLVQSILEPSLEIAPQFVAWSIARTDGTVFTGMVVGESVDGRISFADSTARVITVHPSEIEERRPQTSSIMPDNLPATMTRQEFRDLVAFLLSRL